VKAVTARADTIQGEFTNAVAYPSGSPDAVQVSLFTTQRPSFATDDLFGSLQAKNVTINPTAPDAPPPLWQQIVVGFGPTLLFVGLLVWFLQRVARGRGTRRARWVRPVAGVAL
jgi:cell division protease FtsH